MKTIKILRILCLIALVGCDSGNQITCDKFPIKIKSQIYKLSKSDSIITGNSGIVIHIPKGAFSEDSVNLSLIECLTLDEMINYGLSTQATDGRILVSSGMFNLELRDNIGNIVSLHRPLKIEVPTAQFGSTNKIFSGEISHNETVVWRKESNRISPARYPVILGMDEKAVVIAKDTSSIFYSFETSSYGWFNIDRYLESEETIDIDIVVNNDNDKLNYILAFKNFKTVIKCSIDNGTRTFKNVPINEDVVLIGLGEKEEMVIYSNLEFKSNSRNIIAPIPRTLTKIEFKKTLQKNLSR